MRKLLLTTILTVFSLVGFAQTDIDGKLSITTQMFLDELKGNLEFSPTTSSTSKPGRSIREVDSHKLPNERIYAAPDTIDGIAYISCFVTLDDNSDTSSLEALGVIVQCKFNAGIITCLIPVDKIEEVAAIGRVSKIEVSALKKPMTDVTRQKTNVDDVLTNSTDAQTAGLLEQYDGTGVVLGVIDTGIDFQHIAFKDKDGNSRIKRAYVYKGSGSATEYTSITSSAPTTDTSSQDHGTHTCSTAGGSSVVISGSSVTVTDDHANATYGGMAPGADLYLAGIADLSDTYIANAFQKIINYADDNNQPVVISNSWGSQRGPHDGTGDFADIMAGYFGDNYPNHICLFAASNDAGQASASDGGGYHLSGTATASNPLGTIIRYNYYSDTDGAYLYDGVIANAWARSTNALACKVYVLNDKTGEILSEKTVTSSGTSVSVSSYFSGSLTVYFDESSTGKHEVLLYANQLITRSHSSYDSNYTLAVEFYPTSGSTVIDVWGENYSTFAGYLTTSGHTWTAGSDDMSVSDEATDPNVISIGAYVSKNQITDYSGSSHSYSSYYTVDDIAYFSSYATAAESPTGLQYPWITAPGARLVAGVNHYCSDYTTGDYKTDRVNANTTYPYAAMEGTSMATPAAAGIVALWLQAAQEVGKNMTVNDIKEVMKETAINDTYTTTGANASHFGNGKIDALAGIQYILGASSQPTIKATPTTIEFDENSYVTRTYTKTVTVKGLNLEGNITAALTPADGVFSIDKTTITQTDGSAQADITITWSPVAEGTQTALLTLSSTNAENVEVNITGTAKPATPFILAEPTSLTFSADLDTPVTKTFSVMSEFLTEDITVTLNDVNNVFSVTPTTISRTDSEEDEVEVTVTFSATQDGSYSGSIVLSSDGAESVTISLSGTASDGGTASDSYLNIAKYATISDAGWNKTLVDSLYRYTEYEDDGVAWLTLPVYGGFVGAKYATDETSIGSGNPQAWIKSNITSTSGSYTGNLSWAAYSPYMLGYSAYYYTTDANPRAIGNNSRTSTTEKTVTFYVTNTTAVQLYGKHAKSSSSSYPSSLIIYECTKNTDGTLTESTDATKELTYNTSNGTFNLTADDLDSGAIYKVVASLYRGYLYEIGFQTPLKTVLIGDVDKDGDFDVSDVTAQIEIILQGDTTEPYTLTQYDHEAADVDQDGDIDVADVTALIDIILKSTE